MWKHAKNTGPRNQRLLEGNVARLWMLVVTTSVSSGCVLTLLNDLHNADNDFRMGDSAPLSISVFGKTFHSFNGILDWMSRFPEGQVRVDVWIDIVTQLSRFFRGSSELCSVIAKAVRVDKSFALCKWTIADVADLLEPLEIHVEADKKLCNRSNEALNTINIRWGMVAAEQIARKGYFN